MNGGNLEELLQDIDTISQDILEMSNEVKRNCDDKNKPYKSELNVVLMPKPMDLIGDDLQASLDNIKKSTEDLANLEDNPLGRFPKLGWDVEGGEPSILPPFLGNPMPNYAAAGSDNYFTDSCDNKNEETSNKINEKKNEEKPGEAAGRGRKTRKVSIYFKGKKDKARKAEPKREDRPEERQDAKKEPAMPKVESKAPVFEKIDPQHVNSDAKTSSDSRSDRKHRKSSSTSPERKHHHQDAKRQHKKRHKKSDRRPSQSLRRQSTSLDRRDRSFSICTDRSHGLEQRFGSSGHFFDEFTTSERERTNSLSSCDTSRKNSMLNLPSGGKIPWFGCWGNGCI